MHIVILQRLPDDRQYIEEAMKKICPELLEHTTICGYLSDVKSVIKVPDINLLKKGKKEVLVVTGTVLMDENGDRVIKKIKKWNPGAKIVIFSVDPNNISNKKEMASHIMWRMYKHKTQECNENLAQYIKDIVSTKQATSK